MRTMSTILTGRRVDAEEALALGDRIALMKAGRIVEIASPQALYERPQSPEGAGLFPGCQMIGGEALGGVFHSLLGEAPAAGLPDGPARAILRADCLSAAADPDGAFVIADVRFAGPGWRVILEDGKTRRLSVLMDAPPETGARVSAAADWSKAFFFTA